MTINNDDGLVHAQKRIAQLLEESAGLMSEVSDYYYNHEGRENTSEAYNSNRASILNIRNQITSALQTNIRNFRN